MDGIDALGQAQSTYFYVFISIFRYLAPVMAAWILLRCMKPLLTFRKEPEIWAWLTFKNGERKAVTHWENVIGRSKRSDITLRNPAVSKSHCVLTRYDDGTWTVTDTDSKTGTYVNGEEVSFCVLESGDVITVGDEEMTLQPISAQEEYRLAQQRTQASTIRHTFSTLLLLTVFQVLCCIAYLLGGQIAYAQSYLLGFGGIILCQWLLLLFYICIRRVSFEVETIAFFLCTMGMAAIASVTPAETMKQLIAMVLGLVVFLIIGWSLRDMKRTKVVRYLAVVAGIGFLVITLLFGKEYYGAKNWLVIGSFSVQPSEFSKVCFVFVGASTMDRLFDKRNLILLIGYAVAICACLALMNDFGTALIFFCAFLVVAYMRSGSVGTIALACTSLGFAGVVALKIAPHALRRFSTWRHIWQAPLEGGYQQTRALMCMASGGLLGLGAGNGWMKNLFAADSDVVVATITEEWGLIILLLMIFSIVSLAFFVVRSASMGRNSFLAIGSCTAVSILLVQVILNALGTVDVVPLTGVTFPFLSNGGSSMICSWGLLAFVKAADTRQNASFTIPRLKNGGDEDD